MKRLPEMVIDQRYQTYRRSREPAKKATEGPRYFGRGRKALEDVGNLSLGSKKMKNKTKTQTSRNYMRSYLKQNIHM